MDSTLTQIIQYLILLVKENEELKQQIKFLAAKIVREPDMKKENANG